jgi:GNAT superfamily N-acetyltransferase
MDGDIRIRPAVASDREWILALVPRLHEFGPPPIRPLERMNAAVVEELEAAIDDPPKGSALLVATSPDGAPLGFTYLVTASDFFTLEDHGHVSELIVDRAGEGRGAGRALLAAGEEWAREQGYRLITLNVFEGNARARALYTRIGYSPDTLKMTKIVG